MTRPDGRAKDEMRPVKLTTGFTMYAGARCWLKWATPQVICTASVEEKVPPFLEGKGLGWVTAEYAMLPRSTNTRKKRDIKSLKLDGRSSEIQRLIGRALRAVVDREALGERQITIDCDVIQADGGTRCASITGGYAALYLACRKLVDEGVIEKMPLTAAVSAVSVGIFEDEAVLDLNSRRGQPCHRGLQRRHDLEGRVHRGAGHGRRPSVHTERAGSAAGARRAGLLQTVRDPEKRARRIKEENQT
ncbi:MAG: ribonuclease PH [Butyricicoccaceae bacterium]